MNRPTYKQIKVDLLEKVSKHIRDGELGHKVFDFTVVNGPPQLSVLQPSGCGSHGCAMGELPIIFPERWRFSDTAGVALHPEERATLRDDEQDLIGQVAYFFGLWRDEVGALFFPYFAGVADTFARDLIVPVSDTQSPSRPTVWHCQKLPGSATRTQVADNLDLFIAYHKANP